MIWSRLLGSGDNGLNLGTWIEFRGSIDDSDAFHRLVSGIRGVTPGPGEPDALR
jgi:hypothetical protein